MAAEAVDRDMKATGALQRNTASRQELLDEVRRALKAIGHVPEESVMAVLPDEQLEAIAAYHSPGFRVA